MSSNPFFLDPDAASFPSSQGAFLRQSVDIMKATNAQRSTIYLQSFRNWATSVEAGRTPNTDPPKPPRGMKLSDVDPVTGYTYAIEGGEPVCAMPPIPADSFHHEPLMANTIEVGKSIGGRWHSVGARDTFPSGKTTPPVTSADGVTGTFEKFGAPVGAGWYLQVS